MKVVIRGKKYLHLMLSINLKIMGKDKFVRIRKGSNDNLLILYISCF